MSEPEDIPPEEPDSSPEESKFRDSVGKRSGGDSSRPKKRNSIPPTGPIYLVRGKDRGEPAWHYVMVSRAKLPLFLEAVKSGTFDCADYGEVLESGWGKDPPDEVVQRMKDEYD